MTDPTPTHTTIDVAAIRARADAATAGPWTAWDRGVGYHIALGEERDQWGRPNELLPAGDRSDIARPQDAEFIAHARTDIPNLLDRITELETERDTAGWSPPGRRSGA